MQLKIFRNTILKYSIQYISRMNRVACACFSPQIYIGNYMCTLYTGQLAELPTILDSFYWFSQYYQHSYRVGSNEGRWGAMQWQGKYSIFTKNSKMASIGAFFISTSGVAEYVQLTRQCQTKISKLQPTITIYFFQMYMHIQVLANW